MNGSGIYRVECEIAGGIMIGIRRALFVLADSAASASVAARDSFHQQYPNPPDTDAPVVPRSVEFIGAIAANWIGRGPLSALDRA